MEFHHKQRLSEADVDKLLASLVNNKVIQKNTQQPPKQQRKPYVCAGDGNKNHRYVNNTTNFTPGRFCSSCNGGNLVSYLYTKALYRDILQRVCSCCGVKKRLLFEEDRKNPDQHSAERDRLIRDREVKLALFNHDVKQGKADDRYSKDLESSVYSLYTRRALTDDNPKKRKLAKKFEDIPEPLRKRLRKQVVETVADSKRGVRETAKLLSVSAHLKPDRERETYIARQCRRRVRTLLAAAAKKKTKKKQQQRRQPKQQQQQPYVYFTPLPEEVEDLPELPEGLCYKRKKIVDKTSGEVTHKIVTRAIKRNKGKKKKQKKIVKQESDDGVVELPKIYLTRAQKEVEHVSDAGPSFDARPSLGDNSRVFGVRSRTTPQTLLELVNSTRLTDLSIFLRSRSLAHSNYLTSPDHGLSAIGDYRCLFCREKIETQYRDGGGFYDEISYFEGCKVCSCSTSEEGTIKETSEVSGQFTVCDLLDDGGSVFKVVRVDTDFFSSFVVHAQCCEAHNCNSN